MFLKATIQQKLTVLVVLYSLGIAEKHIQQTDKIETPQHLYNLLDTCSEKFNVMRMGESDFKDFKSVSSATVNVLNRRDNLGEKLKFNATRIWKFSACHPFQFFFKYTFYPSEPFKHIDIKKRSSHQQTPSLASIPTQPNIRLLSAPKYKDLCYLSRFLTHPNRQFYLDLPHSAEADFHESVEESFAPTWDLSDEIFYEKLDEEFGEEVYEDIYRDVLEDVE